MTYETKVGPFTFYQYNFWENRPKDCKKLFHSYRNFYEKQKIKNHIEITQQNMRFDLENLTREKLLENVHDRVRHDLRKAERNGMVVCEVSGKEFVEKYNNFARNKKINEITEKTLEDLSEGNNMRISKAVYKDMAMAYFLVVYDSYKALDVFCFPNRFEYDKLEGQLTSCGYKYLLVDNLMYFTKKNLKYFDWGGMYLKHKNPQIVRLSEAKLLFGGEVIEVYEYQSLGYFLVYKLKKTIEDMTGGKIQYLWSVIRKDKE